MIDPQEQANRWIKNLFKDQNLQVVRLSQHDYIRTLENAIHYGAPLLLENIGAELDPVLEPVLLKQTYRRSGQLFMTVGDSDVPYNENFRFFLTTNLPNPHYLPEICIKVTIVNFTVTLRGLEDQLLVDVVRSERPELEQKRDELIISISADKKQLKSTEDKILKMLANATGNILDDEASLTTFKSQK